MIYKELVKAFGKDLSQGNTEKPFGTKGVETKLAEEKPTEEGSKKESPPEEAKEKPKEEPPPEEAQESKKPGNRSRARIALSLRCYTSP